MNHLGSPADTSYGKGREIRLIDGEIEIAFSDRLPVYALILRTEGAAIQPGAWRHIAISYTGGKSAANLRLFVDGRELPTRVLYDGVASEQPKKDFLIGADNALVIDIAALYLVSTDASVGCVLASSERV